MGPKIKMIFLTTYANANNRVEQGNLDIRDSAWKIVRRELYHILCEYMLKERFFSLNGLFFWKKLKEHSLIIGH